MFAVLAFAWETSALWFIGENGFPDPLSRAEASGQRPRGTELGSRRRGQPDALHRTAGHRRGQVEADRRSGGLGTVRLQLGGRRPPGRQGVFTDNCGSCHTLQAAGTSGQVGPSLDDISLSPADIEGIVREGRGGMPAFGGRLSDAEITAAAAFIAGQR